MNKISNLIISKTQLIFEKRKRKRKEKKISLNTSELLQVMFVKRTDPIGGWTHLIPKKFFLKLISTFLFFTSNQSLFITI
jgi:hypothetical protein